MNKWFSGGSANLVVKQGLCKLRYGAYLISRWKDTQSERGELFFQREKIISQKYHVESVESNMSINT